MPSFDPLSPQQLTELNPLQLAYIGDSVYDLLVRSRLLKDNFKLRTMHKNATGQVNAVAQAQTLQRILPYLNEPEKEYVRRGRNAHARHSVPKSATPADYAASTALETLFGYLYVCGQEDRIMELFELSLVTTQVTEIRD